MPLGPRNRLPAFIALAILAHFILGGLSFTVYLGSDIIVRATQQVRELLVFTHVSRETLVRARQNETATTDSIGARDAATVELPDSPDMPRTPLESLAPLDLPLATVPPAAQDQPPQLKLDLEFSPQLPTPALAASQAPEFSPARMQRSTLEASDVPLEALAPPSETSSPPPPVIKLEVDRAAPPLAPVSMLAPRSLTNAVEATQASAVPPTADTPLTTKQMAKDQDFAVRSPHLAEVIAERIPLDPTLPAPTPTSEPRAQLVKSLDITLARRLAASPPALRAPLPVREEAIIEAQSALQASLPITELTPPVASTALVHAPLDRFGPPAQRLLVAEDNIGLTRMLQMRHGAAKQDALLAFGGNQQTLEAVQRGLRWLAQHQHPDGFWSLDEFHQQCQGHECQSRGRVSSNIAATGLALMAYLGDGHSHQSGDYQDTVKRGLLWLATQQDQHGDFGNRSLSNAHLYSHAIATIAMCEAYAMTRDEQFAEPARRAVAFIIAAQHQGSGGWRYHPNEHADTSVVGWQIMALKSAQMAGIDVPRQTFDNARSWLAKVERGGKERGHFGYQGPDNSPAMTAEALLCLEYIGAPRDDPSLVGGVNFLLERLPQENQETSYYWYYGTQAMYHVQGAPWEKWNGALREILLKTQIKDGHQAGTWDVRDNWEQQGGRIYSTCLRLLMLEAYYRHLPLY